MNDVVGWLITALLVAVILGFIGYLIASAHTPDERPRVATYDRTGARMADQENPGAAIAPGRPGDPMRAPSDAADDGR